MKSLLLALGTAALFAGAIMLSGPRSSAENVADPNGGALQISSEEKNPWTNLKINDDPNQIRFAVVSDRTGGHRAKVFSRAVQQINLLQPNFVMSVGDLIEGYSVDMERVTGEWNEFDGYLKPFTMPFFYVPGNHDLTNEKMVEKWQERYGRKYYHFVYKDVLFLCLCSENPPNMGTIDKEQQEWVAKVLKENENVRWTFTFLHKPIWTARDLEANGWAAVEKALAGRNYTVYCGHVHRYQKFVRNGMNYYQLATTGGGSRVRGPEYGEFDHVSWVTMTNDKPVIANVLLNGVLAEDLSTPESDEPGVNRKTVPVFPAKVKVKLGDKPVKGATVALFRETNGTSRYTQVCDGLTTADGSAMMSTYTAFDGAPEGQYTVTLVKFNGYREPAETRGENQLPEKYASPNTSPLRLSVSPNDRNEMEILIED